jgi:hypothetical protein
LKRREEKEENNKKKRSKKYRKEKPEKVGRMVAPVYNFESWTQKYCRKDQLSCNGRGGGQGTSYLIAAIDG